MRRFTYYGGTTDLRPWRHTRVRPGGLADRTLRRMFRPTIGQRLLALVGL